MSSTSDRRSVTNDDSPLADTAVHYLSSAHVGEEFKIFAGQCGTNDAQPESVLYLTDANGFFGGAVDLVRSMQLSRHLPPMLVVGIGYRAGGLGDTIVRRTADLTPTSDLRYARLFPAESRMGGADALLSFLATELQPWVDARYGTAGVDTTYFGHSLGGLFGVHALLQAPETFQRYVIGSPSLWWHDRVIFAEESAYAAAHADLAATVFFGIGALETQDGREREATNMDTALREMLAAHEIDMVDDMSRFVDRLRSRAYPGLELTSEVFADEFHVTVPLLNLGRGLRRVYDAPR